MTIGIDIEDIERFENKSQRFLDRIYTKNEQQYCLSKAKPESHLAVRFCAKEAVIKALNAMNIAHPQLNKIEIYHDESKCPKVRLLGKLFEKVIGSVYDDLTIDVSLSHDKTKAIAFVTIVERLKG